MDTAAVIKNLDLVITADTAIAHLAGGLGAPGLVGACRRMATGGWFENRDDESLVSHRCDCSASPSWMNGTTCSKRMAQSYADWSSSGDKRPLVA